MTAQMLDKSAPSAAKILADGRQVLETEIIALQKLAGQLNGTFIEAVETLAACKGRVIVTGIGKSGHIARKIAATLASTGTPSIFVHPSEASHGDLGMVTRDDVVIALSNSGEASELGDIVGYAKRFSIPLIAISSRKESTLGAQADIVLELPQAEEACPMGMAPTSSTTMMIAVGDALAITLLKKNNFTSSDYKVFHPGGKLGKRLLLVRDLMHTGDAVPLATLTAPMSDIILIMTQKTFGCCGIVDQNKRLIGIITDGDLRRHMGDKLFAMKAEEVMTRAPKTIGAQALGAEALGRMNEKKITSLFVVNEAGTVDGIVRMHDVLKAGVV